MSIPDDPRIVANSPAAPASERFDAQSELSRTYRPLSSQLIPSSDIKTVIDFIRDDMAQADMMKASGASIIQFPGRSRPEPKKGMRSVYIDDLQIFASGEYYEKPSPIGFDGLRRMVDETPVLTSVVMTRIRQMSRFFAPSEDGGPGFEIRHIDRKHKLTGDEQKQAALISQFMQNCGWEFNPTKRKMLKRDNFRGLMGKLVRDSLTMDAAPIEREMKRDARQGIDGIYAVDGATIRLCTEEGYEGDDKIFALQTVQGRVATAYTNQQLIYEVRNPRTDVRLAGYGLGEPETLIRVVTGFLNAMTYNINGFDKNAIPKGMLQLVGDYDTEDLASFKRQWNAMVRGINNAWSLPVLVNKDPAGKATFEKFGVDFDEMYFAKWMTFLVSIICSIYGMAPDEINFESFASNKSSLSGSDTTEKLAGAKDSGLRPDLQYWESVLTDFVVTDFNDKLCFRWQGLEQEDDDKVWEGKKLTLSVDELRAQQGDVPWAQANPTAPDMGSAPLNPSLIGTWQQAMQPAPEQPQGDFGTPEDGQPGKPMAGQDGAGGKQPGADPDQGAQPDMGQQQPAGDFGGGDDQGDFGKALAPPEIFAIGGK